MRKCIGILCISLGVICLLSAIGFVVYNRWEDESAESTANALLWDVQSKMDEKAIASSDADPLPTEMASITVADEDCIGILSIPVLELELPVLKNWSYAKLKKAPCHYYGTYYENNFVIAAHNYESHFGRLSKLKQGDLVLFTDVNGVIYYYEVVLLETLSEEATKEMIDSGFDLSLYTCTTGGSGRVTVRCKVLNNN